MQAAWVEKCKALPNLSKDESVIKQWKELILEGLRLEHPGDWKDVQWPKSIQNRIDAIPAGVFSVQRHRTPEEAVREAIESGLEQLSREI